MIAWEQAGLSRRDHVMVARHEMPGNAASRTRPVGYGMIGLRGHVLWSCMMDRSTRQGSIRRGGDGSCLAAFQAFHAWLPSIRPSGTVLAP
jgi:hypothetical protein